MSPPRPIRQPNSQKPDSGAAAPSKTPQLVGRNRPIDHLEMYSIVRSRLEVLPQLVGRKPAVGWKLYCTILCAIYGLSGSIVLRLFYSFCFLVKTTGIIIHSRREDRS